MEHTGVVRWFTRHPGLRHSANSILLSLGQPPFIVAALLGHELPGSTLGTYLTTAEPDILDACAALAGALSNAKGYLRDTGAAKPAPL